jgi:outer membrane protein OmpA-like peptidoglycan-associated protein
MNDYRLTQVCAFLAAISATRAATADTAPGYAVNQFNPSERGSTYFSEDSLDVRGNGRLALGIVGDYSHRVLTHRDGGIVFASPLREQFVMHFGASVNLVDRVRLSLNIPLQAYALGNNAYIGTTTFAAPTDDVSVGDVRVGIDVRLFGAYGDNITGAIGAQLFAPSGSPGAFSGDGTLRFMPKFAIAGSVGRFVYASHLGVMLRGRNEGYAQGYVGSELRFGVAGGVKLLDDKVVVGPELIAATAFGDSFGARTTPVEALVGARWNATSEIRVGLGGGFGLTQSYGAPSARALLSVEWTALDPADEPEVAADSDGDGVPDADDACRYAAGPKSLDKTVNGCPIPDTDNDGIRDELDACRCVRGVAAPDPAKNGCPLDDDGDGIINEHDACPSVAGKASADPKVHGCPERDTDGDKILDDEDACPNKAGVHTLDPKTNGCPETDRDHDGILNDVDACPDLAGPKDDSPARNGCPRAHLDGKKIQIIDQVKFATASAVIANERANDEVLEAVVAVLKAHPEIKKVRIEGHTDNVGNAKTNKALSAARAAAVVKWLTKHGIAKEALVAEGMGGERPLEPNDTDAGKKANRRVEFHVEAE